MCLADQIVVGVMVGVAVQLIVKWVDSKDKKTIANPDPFS